MKIVLAAGLYPPDIGGPATFAKQLADFLDTKNVVVEVMPFSAVRHVPPIVRHLYYAFLVWQKSRGARYIVALDPVSVGLPSLCASRLRGVPMILRVGGDFAWEQGVQRFGVTDMLDAFVVQNKKVYSRKVQLLARIQSYVAQGATRVVVPSDYLKQLTGKWGVRPDNIRRIYSSAEVGALPPRDVARREFGFGDEKVIVSAGRFVPWKGFPALIDAVRLVQKEFAGAKLIIAGSGPDDARIRAHGKALLDTDVVFMGDMARAQLLKLVCAADVFALNTNYEGLSHQLIEVMQAGVPVITTPVGGNVELIEDKISGRLVAFNDVEALAKAINETLTQVKQTAHMVATARTKGQAFSKTDSMVQWADVLGVRDNIQVLMLSGDPHMFNLQSDVRKRLLLQAEEVSSLTVFAPLPARGRNKNDGEWVGAHVRVIGFNGTKIQSALRMLLASRQVECDVVTAQDPFYLGLIAWIIAYRKSATFQLQIHTNIFSPEFKRQHRLKMLLSQFLLRHADCIRVVSEDLKKSLEVAGITAPITVQPIFIDKDAISKAQAAHMSEEFPQFSHLILVAARLEKEKNIDDILNALPEILKHLPDAGLLVAGEGSQQQALKALALEKGVGGHVVFLGQRSDVYSLYKGVDLVFAATAVYEGYGATAVEALACGTPVIAVRDAGIVTEAGGIVVSPHLLAKEVVRVLHAKTPGMLRIVLPTAVAWAKLWRKSLTQRRVNS